MSGVESALEGRSVGDTFDVVVSPEDGYGKRDPELDVAIPLSAFLSRPAGLMPGARFQAPHPTEGKTVLFIVIKVKMTRSYAPPITRLPMSHYTSTSKW